MHTAEQSDNGVTVKDCYSAQKVVLAWRAAINALLPTTRSSVQVATIVARSPGLTGRPCDFAANVSVATMFVQPRYAHMVGSLTLTVFTSTDVNTQAFRFSALAGLRT